MQLGILASYAGTRPDIPVEHMNIVIGEYKDAVVKAIEASGYKVYDIPLAGHLAQQRQEGDCVHMVALGALANLLLDRCWRGLQRSQARCSMWTS
jgi:hypothetical protein